MPAETVLLFVQLFAASVWTPGPNNAMLAASGATFGFRATLPHMAGVILGFSLMLFLVGLGFGPATAAVPALVPALRVVGVLLFLWVAWRVATMAPPGAPGARGRPFTFLEAAAFQWVNPKAWALALGMVSLFVAPEAAARHAAIIAAVAALVSACSASSWTGFGALLQRVLARPGRLRAFNLAMAALILAGLAGILLGDAL